jgi:hypothetical protein
MELFCRRFFLRAGNGLRWAWHVAEIGRAFVRENSGHRTTVFSTYPPIGTHLAAYLIAGTERAPWIGSFQIGVRHRQPHPLCLLTRTDQDVIVE